MISLIGWSAEGSPSYQRNQADLSWLSHFGFAPLGRWHGKLHQDAAPTDGSLYEATCDLYAHKLGDCPEHQGEHAI